MIRVRFNDGKSEVFDSVVINRDMKCMSLIKGKICMLDVAFDSIESIEKQLIDLSLKEIDKLGGELTKVHKTRIFLNEFRLNGDEFELGERKDDETYETYNMFYDGALYDSDDYVDITNLIKEE